MTEDAIRVLLIEDDPDDALLIRETLSESSRARFTVDRVDRLSAGLERLDLGGVDVVLLDLGLPDSQGIGTFQTAHDRAPEVPFVVMTGLDDEEVGLSAMRAGAQDYLVKGQVRGELVARSLRYAIERRRLELRLEKALADLDREFRSVADVQISLLPSELPELPGFEVATHYKPAERAGGDYFDFLPLPRGKTGVLIADVSGHGAPAAVLMAMARVLVHTSGELQPPGDVLARLNDALCDNIPAGQFVTVCYGALDPEARTFEFATAGHPPPLYVPPEGEPHPLGPAAVNLALGLVAGTQYEEDVAELEPGASLVLYTDGVTEARNESGAEFGRRGLSAAVSADGAGSAEGVRDAILRALSAHVGEAPLWDDITLVVLRAQG